MSLRQSIAPASWAFVAGSMFLFWRGWLALSGAPGGVGHAVLAEGLVLVGPAVLVLVALTLVAERIWPAVDRPLTAPGHLQDSAYLAVYVVLAVPIVTLLGTGFAVTLLHAAPWLTIHPLSAVPRWTLVVAVVVLMDACNWFAHYVNHHVASCWRFHALHHSQEEMSILTSFRAHPLVHASFQIAAVPLLILGTSSAVPLPVLVGYVLLSTLPHANVDWDFGPLRKVIVSPAYHRLHHHRDDERGVNLGTVLTLWDQLAGIAEFAERGSVPVATGIRGRPIPVEQAQNVGNPIGLLWHQLCEPLWRAKAAGQSTGQPNVTDVRAVANG